MNRIMIHDISKLFDESSDIILKSKILSNEIQKVVKIILGSLKDGNKLIIFGNGGSAADAQHMAAELIGKYRIERKSIPAIAITTDTSILTAIGNDYGFDKVFSRQCNSLVDKGDVIIAISTSGKSENVVNGIKAAKKKGGFIVSLTGKNGGRLKTISDIIIKAPSNQTPRIQEVHRTIIHIICDLVERQFK